MSVQKTSVNFDFLEGLDSTTLHWLRNLIPEGNLAFLTKPKTTHLTSDFFSVTMEPCSSGRDHSLWYPALNHQTDPGFKTSSCPNTRTVFPNLFLTLTSIVSPITGSKLTHEAKTYFFSSPMTDTPPIPISSTLPILFLLSSISSTLPLLFLFSSGTCPSSLIDMHVDIIKVKNKKKKR
jgi:hypothetical protein